MNSQLCGGGNSKSYLTAKYRRILAADFLQSKQVTLGQNCERSTSAPQAHLQMTLNGLLLVMEQIPVFWRKTSGIDDLY